MDDDVAVNVEKLSPIRVGLNDDDVAQLIEVTSPVVLRKRVDAHQNVTTGLRRRRRRLSGNDTRSLGVSSSSATNSGEAKKTAMEMLTGVRNKRRRKPDVAAADERRASDIPALLKTKPSVVLTRYVRRLLVNLFFVSWSFCHSEFWETYTQKDDRVQLEFGAVDSDTEDEDAVDVQAGSG